MQFKDQHRKKAVTFSYEMDYCSDNWRRLEDFFELISGHDDIFYGTNAEVCCNGDRNHHQRFSHRHGSFSHC